MKLTIRPLTILLFTMIFMVNDSVAHASYPPFPFVAHKIYMDENIKGGEGYVITVVYQNLTKKPVPFSTTVSQNFTWTDYNCGRSVALCNRRISESDRANITYQLSASQTFHHDMRCTPYSCTILWMGMLPAEGTASMLISGVAPYPSKDSRSTGTTIEVEGKLLYETGQAPLPHLWSDPNLITRRITD